MIRALFNDRPLVGPRTGVGQYLAQILAHWPGDARVIPVGIIGSVTLGRLATPAAGPDPAAPLELRPLSALERPAEGARGVDLARRGYELATAAAFRAANLAGRSDVVFEPNHIPPPTRVPVVTTIHDLSVLELPEHHPSHRVRAWERGLARAVECSSRFICVSEATADAMERVLSVPRDRTRVIHLAPRWSRPAAMPGPIPGVPERYLVHLGTIEPRKNIAVLLDALATMPEPRRPELVLVGRPGWGPPAFWDALTSHPMADRVRVTGFVTDAQARALVAGSAGVLCPSVYEGFGLPALEAMAMGVPVAVSTAPSLTEVVADAAPALDPHDAGAWAREMEGLTQPDTERDARIERGVARAAGFSWEAAARAHEETLLDAAGG